MPGVLHRCVKLISGIKKSVADMRAEAEAATCYREKCSIILSTAIGASVALDQVGYSEFTFFWNWQAPVAASGLKPARSHSKCHDMYCMHS